MLQSGKPNIQNIEFIKYAKYCNIKLKNKTTNMLQTVKAAKK